ncbi:MAG: hypothetical protein SO005_08225 [Candidatus Choladocola sp.]|nr:hypothetical protein [Candidatus Choladocola sp.]
MKNTLIWILSTWNQYWGDGFYQYLLILSIIYLLFQKKKEESKKGILLYSLVLLLVFFLPFTAIIIRACIGEDVYWRVLWLLPTIPLIALAASDFLRKRKTKITKGVLLLVFCVIIACCGEGMFSANNYILSDNPQKVPSEVAYLCNLIHEKAAQDGISQVRLATDDHLATYARVYDPSILMPYGRRAKGAMGKVSNLLYEQLNSENPDYSKIALAAKKKECNFIIAKVSDPSYLANFAEYGYTKIGELHVYTVFQLTDP